MIKRFLFLAAFFATTIMHAQDTGPEMADGMRESGKIYVVISVIAIIFISIIIFLVYLERKLSRIEKRIGNTTK